MPTKEGAALAVQIQETYKRISSSARSLNEASDELGQIIAKLDGGLKKLGLGVEARFDYQKGAGDDGRPWSRSIQYRKWNGKWGICIGDFEADLIDEVWLYNEAPRAYRLEAIPHIPRFLERIVEAADEMTAKVRAGSEALDKVATLFLDAAADSSVKK